MTNLTSAEPDLIIDGQQRVTTVTLLLTALAARLEQLARGPARATDGFSPKKIRNRYLLNDDEEGERQFKLILSQSDKDALIAIVQGAHPLPQDRSDAGRDNFAYFQSEARATRGRPRGGLPGLDKLVVVDVTLDRTDGQPAAHLRVDELHRPEASQADLIRNFVLMDLPPKPRRSCTRRTGDRWSSSSAGRRRGQFDDFVRHYLTIKTGEIPRLDDIYEAFKDYAVAFIDAGETVESLVIELRQYARRYCAIALGQETDASSRRASRISTRSRRTSSTRSCSRSTRLRARHPRPRRRARDRRHGDVVHLPPGRLPDPDQLAQQDLRDVRQGATEGPLPRQRQGALPR